MNTGLFNFNPIDEVNPTATSRHSGEVRNSSPAPLEEMNRFSCWRGLFNRLCSWKGLVFSVGLCLAGLGCFVAVSGGIAVGAGICVSAPVGFILYGFGMFLITESGVLPKRE